MRINEFQPEVHLTEPLGDVTILDVEAGGTVMKMALPEEEALAYPAGAELAVAFAAGRHLTSSTRTNGMALY